MLWRYYYLKWKWKFAKYDATRVAETAPGRRIG